MGAALLALGATALVLWVSFPRIGNWYVRSRVLPRYEKLLGRDIAVDSIQVTRGRVVLSGLSVRGPLDAADAPLLRVDRVTADYDFWKAVRGELRIGELTVERPVVHLAATPDGQDNWSDVLERLRKRRKEPAATPGKPRPPRFKHATLSNGALQIDDQGRGVRAGIDDITGSFDPLGALEVTLTTITAGTSIGASAGAERVAVSAQAADVRGTLRVEIAGGRMTPYHGLALTGITGTIAPANPDAGGSSSRAVLDLQGGYGGVEGTLWRADGWLDRAQNRGEMHLRADRFTFDKLAPVLSKTAVLQPEKTSLGASLDVVMTGDEMSIAGELNLDGLTLYHPWMAEKPLKDLGFVGTIKGRFDRRARLFELDALTIDFRGVEARLEGYLALAGGTDGGGPDPLGGPPLPEVARAHPRLRARLIVPTVTCQKALRALPPAITPRLQGFQLEGKFSTNLAVDIDWGNLDATELGGSVGIYGCKVLKAPKGVDTEKFLAEFEHSVEVEKDQWMKFVIGPTNPNFVAYNDISPYLIKSLLTTEDGMFFKHRGFIVSEFRTALVKDLKAGYFKYGASSITMQFVKNLMLHREKTLARKFQELFLTWYVEQTMEKERILEIYLNAIEFGPAIYGIGHASYHYFGKPPRDITAVEAAFFSSILPGPKKRHLQYCDNKLQRWAEAKIGRILKLMMERERITPLEYELALATPLTFVYPADFDAKKCRKETERIMKNSRRTEPQPEDDPLADDEPEPVPRPEGAAASP